MKKFSREQKKIIYIALVVLAFLFSSWVFIYLPQSRRLIKMQKKLKATEEEINQINKITQGKTLEEAVGNLNLELRQAAMRLPSADEDIIEILSREAKKLKIGVQVMDPADESQVLPTKVPGFNIRELPISLKLVGEYRAIGEYLDNLENKVPILIKLKYLNIQAGGAGPGNTNLNVDLEISAYLS